MKTRTKSLLGYLVLLLALVFVSAVFMLRSYASSVQHSAERLQADALTLIPGVTTLGEARAFAGRADRPAGYAGFDGPICDDSQCVVSVGPMAFVRWDNPLLRLFAPFGIHPAHYTVIVEFANGKVRKVVYGVFYKARSDVILSGTVALVQRFSSEDLKIHPYGYHIRRSPSVEGNTDDYAIRSLGLLQISRANEFISTSAVSRLYSAAPTLVNCFKLEGQSPPHL